MAKPFARFSFFDIALLCALCAIFGCSPIQPAVPETTREESTAVAPTSTLIPEMISTGVTPPELITLALGDEHTCVLQAEGRVYCWGSNLTGQLGNEAVSEPYQSSFNPLPVTSLNSGAIGITAGGGHTCALTQDGGVQCWGRRYGGYQPADVAGLDSGVIQISSGGNNNCALLADGTVKCWGFNPFGLGDGMRTEDYVMEPVSVSGLNGEAIAIGAGREKACAIMRSGEVYCWGRGPLGDGSTEDSPIPVKVAGMDEAVTAIDLGNPWICALTTSRRVKCWGFTDPALPGVYTPIDVAGIESGAASISVAGAHACALLLDGSAACWGSNTSGVLGDGTNISRPEPARVADLDGRIALLDTGLAHTCAMTADFKFYCWGLNSSGQLGGETPFFNPALLPLLISLHQSIP